MNHLPCPFTLSSRRLFMSYNDSLSQINYAAQQFINLTWVNSNETSFFERQVLARAGYAVLTPLSVGTVLFDTFVGAVGSLAALATLTLNKSAFNFAVRHLSYSNLLLADPFENLLKTINPNAQIHEDKRNGFISAYVIESLHEFAKMTYESDSNALIRHGLARLTYALAAVAAVVTRVADIALGLVAGALALLTFGAFDQINSIAYKALKAPGVIADLMECGFLFINPGLAALRIETLDAVEIVKKESDEIEDLLGISFQEYSDADGLQKIIPKDSSNVIKERLSRLNTEQLIAVFHAYKETEFMKILLSLCPPKFALPSSKEFSKNTDINTLSPEDFNAYALKADLEFFDKLKATFQQLKPSVLAYLLVTRKEGIEKVIGKHINGLDKHQLNAILPYIRDLELFDKLSESQFPLISASTLYVMNDSQIKALLGCEEEEEVDETENFSLLNDEAQDLILSKYYVEA